MKKPKVRIILGASLIVLVGWVLWPAGKPTTDDERYQQVKHAITWSDRFVSMEHWLPVGLADLLNVRYHATGYRQEAEAQTEPLFASGYMTNAFILISNWPWAATTRKPIHAELSIRLANVPKDSNVLYFDLETNGVRVICRSRDLPLIQRALQTP
jgi:hypothetical protein